MKDLLLKLMQAGINIDVVNDELQLSNIPHRFQESDLMVEVKTHKKKVIEFIKERKQANTEVKAIAKATAKQLYHASPQQRRLFFLHQIAPSSLFYNISQAYTIKGKLDVEQLKKAFELLIQRHETLRTSFSVVDKKVVQTISDEVPLNFEYIKAGNNDISSTVTGFIRPFNLTDKSLFRAGLIEIAQDEHVLVLDMHHLISDGVSQQILIKEFAAAYNNRQLSATDLQYKDYSEWVHDYYKDQLHLLKDFWTNKFADNPKPCQLPLDFSRPETKNYDGSTISFSVDAKVTKQLYALAHSANTSLFTVLISAFGVLLAKLTNQEDIVIGTPVSGRTHPDLDNIVGLFVNTLPIRLQPDAKLSYRSYLEQVSSGVLACFDHQDYPLEQLIDDLKLDRSLSNNPLFDVVFVLQNMEEASAAFENMEISNYSLNNKSSKFDLTLAAVESAGTINFSFEFSKQLFKQATIERFARYFEKVLIDTAQNENITLEDVNILSDEEKDFLLNVNNKLSVGYPKDKTIVSLFEEQVKQRPGAVAIVFEDIALTYQQLNQRANQLARILRSKGCVANTVVGLLTGRGPDTVIAMLAILKAGGAYLPIDTDYPAERINYNLANSGVELLVTYSNQADAIAYNHQYVFIDEINTDAAADLSNLDLEISPDDLCYIIYTSGTTGNPKGAMIEHKNVVRLLFNNDFQFDFGPDDIWTMFHSHTFDFSVWEMYGALLYGGKLIIIKKEEALDPVKYLKILDTQKVTILNQTPTAFSNLIQEDLKQQPSLSCLRYVIFGGEALQPFKLKKWYQGYPDVKLINMFGITETTVHVTYKEITGYEIENNLSYVGKPIPCTSVYLFTPKMQLAPIGVIAELYVGGEGVARGYLNNKDLTSQRFLANPYRPDERLYRTGDLGRILENGEIEYFGRADRQIQLRGFRIEPGEIEFHLSDHPLIDYTLVTLKKRDDGTTYLCAYYIGKAVIPATEIREYLQGRVPAHMIPSYFIPISHLPQTGNDKIDVSKLPEPEVLLQQDHIEPNTFLEKSLAKIWSEELSVKDIGTTDNFFAIGGDSLKAIGVIHRINTEFKCNLSIADLYKNQTITTLATLMQAAPNYDLDDSYNAAIAELGAFQENYRRSENWDASYEDVFPMSGIEKGMMFYSLKQSFDKKNIHDTSYHEQNTYKIANRNFDYNIFKQALELLVEKHGELRKIYDLKNFTHIIKKHIEPDLNYIDVSDLDPAAQESFVLQRIEDEKLKTTGLDLSVLWRMNIFKTDDISYLLIFDMHHSLFDGWSLHSFITELNNTYKFLLKDPSFKPEKLQCSYQDHIVYELAEANKTDNISFWRNEMAGSNRLGFPRKTEINTFSYKIFDLGEDMRSDLERLAKKHNTSLKHLCFAAYVNAMKFYTSETDIVVGLATNNRPLVNDSEKLLGCFLNSVPFRIDVPEDITCGEYIKLIESKLLTLKKHERVPLEEIVQITDHRSQGENPFFDTFFNYVNFRVLNEMLGLDGAEKFSSPYQDKLDAISYLNVNTFCEFHVLPDPFALCISYATAYFDESVIETLYQCFNHTLNQFIKNEDFPLSQIDILSSEERNKLLYEFNDTATDYPRDRTIIDLFEEQVTRTPDATALICGETRLSYSEFSIRTDHEANRLRARGVKAGELVGLQSGRTAELLIGLYGILKAGAAYMPLDPRYPADRIRYMLEDSGAGYLLCSGVSDAELSGEQVLLEITPADAALPSVVEPCRSASADGLAYVIYTSGSTGRPKGVMIPHRALSNFSKGMSELISFSGKTLLSVTTFSFDIFVLESLVPLQHGATVVLASDAEQQDARLLEAALLSNGVNMLQITPSLMKVLAEEECRGLSGLTEILIGGEAFPPSLLETLQEHTQARIFNMYGPTETTVWSCVKELTNEREITIGKPVANTQIYILGKSGQLQPVGVAGELCISGDGLSRGYLNKPELTAERFTDHPYKAGEKLYHTGDLARWLPDGNIAYLGRLDDQVKIRGYRIELGEIERQLSAHEAISEAVVTARERGGERYLAGYYVSAAELSPEELKGHLSATLPEYMIPQVYVQLPSLPLTPNGKTDRKALPEPAQGSGLSYTAPETELEARLAGIWSSVLQLDEAQISVTAGFFELGGHSLKAATLVNRIGRELETSVPLKAIFTHQDIRSLGRYISGLGKTGYTAIARAAKQPYYALSPAQQRMYFLYELDKGSLAYNMPYVAELEGALDTARLHAAFQKLVGRHESLRTSFGVKDGEVVQRIMEEAELALWYAEATDEASAKAAVSRFIRPFDLAAAPLLRVGLVRLSENEKEDKHWLLADMHHIITDGVSQGILIGDLMALYGGAELPALELQYKDYSEWHQGEQQQAQQAEQRAYWKERFAGGAGVLELPQDHARPAVKGYAGSSRSFKLDAAATRSLKALGESSGATLFMTLLSVLNVLLGKLSGREDITVGTPVAGRYHPELEGIIGMFVNTVALRNYPKGEQGFRGLLSEVKESALSGFAHQGYPYEALVNDLELARDTGRNPLFDVMFTFQNFAQGELEFPGLKLRMLDGGHSVSKFDLTLIAAEAEEELQLTFEYSTALFGAATIDRFIAYFQKIVSAVTADADQKLSQIDILSSAERNKLLYEFNDTATDYPRDRTIIDLFEEQVTRTPDATALICGETRLSYSEFSIRTDHEANRLRARGVKAGELVGLQSGRTAELLIGLYGILKAGAAYMPLDPRYPADRIRYMLEDSGAGYLLCSGVSDAELSGEQVLLEITPADAALPSVVEPCRSASADGLAYVIYTSGSTGRPKGVMIPHRALSNFSKGMSELISFSGKTLLSVTTFSFDIFVLESLVPLQHGATVVLASDAEQQDARLLEAALLSNGVNMLQITPSLMKVLAEEECRGLSGLTEILIGGEAFPPSLLETLQEHTQARIFNMYGPTETTVWSCVKELTNEREITIGKPVANTQIYILGKSGQLQPVGVAGELCISGDGLSRGYLNKPELTAERFTDHPYKAGEKLYHTGDLARWLPDGNIAYLGRLDDQVKIRGYRIELGEIERQLSAHEAISEAVVTARERGGERYLAGYYVSAAELSPEELKGHLSATLPEYMIPQVYVQLPSLPLTPNGKTDRKALPEPAQGSGLSYTAPETELEARLAGIWSSVLQLDEAQISVTAGFFELGGHSLKAATLVNRIGRELETSVPLKAIFTHQDIRSLGRYISGLGKTGYTAIARAAKQPYYALSPAQQRMYFLYELDKGSLAYNMPYVAELEGALDTARLHAAFQKLVGRHESLRTSFGVKDGEVVQRIMEEAELALWYAEATDEASAKAAVSRFIRPFDLAAAPLLRVGLVRLSENEKEDKHWLLADMHHIITDGVSQGILIGDLMALYGGAELPALELQYKDYSEWHQGEQQQAQQAEQRAYWKERFAGGAGVLELPQDHARPAVKGYAGSSRSFKLDAAATRSLKALGESSGATLFMTLLSVLNVLLGKLSGREDITVGTPVAGRYHPELEGIIGMFVNTVALRNYPKGEQGFRGLLSEVKESALSGFAHQGYPYEALVNDLELARDTGRNPLFDVMFTFQNFAQGELEFPGLKLRMLDGGHSVSKFDLTLIAAEAEEELQLTFEYSTALFGAATIDRFIAYFQKIVSAVTADADQKLSQIDILSSAERNKLLYEFNDTATDYPRDRTVIDLFEEQALRTPDNVAVVYGDEQLSYRELNERADQLAAYLQQTAGVKAGDTVGLLLEREAALFPCIYGILKAGAVYVPLSVDYPSARLNTIIGDAGLKVLISRTAHLETLLPGTTAGVLNLDDAEAAIKSSTGPLQGRAGADALAYIIYTSGSTGQPKGVTIRHGSVVNRLLWMQAQYPLQATDVLLQKTSLVFDVSVWELFWWSFTGASVCVPAPGTEKDPDKLLDVIARHGVSTIHFVPSMLSVFLDAAAADRENRTDSLRLVFASGEALGAGQVNRFGRTIHAGQGTRLINLYGPTEATVDVSYYECEFDKEQVTVPIGKPIWNTGLYITDKNGSLSPVGVAGELCISGDGLSRGYLNKPELTAERFTDHPYKAGEKMYHTGDLARWLPDGNIAYLGRLDDQVKIRGYRIELGEIERQLTTHPTIREAVIMACEREGNKYLVGYYVSDNALNISDLRSHLSKTLPEYMIPSYFVHLNFIPLTINGKADRKSLPKPEFVAGDGYVAPSNEAERKLTTIWSEVLELDPDAISADVNFFELGGHSIHAVQVTNKIQGVFGVKIGLRQIFESSTISELAGFIAQAQPANENAIPKTLKKQYYLTSPAQERMYFGYLLDTNNTNRNISSIIELSEAPDVEKLEAAFKALIERHSGLRTCFELTNEGVVQQILPHVNFKLACINLGNETLESCFKAFIQPFDLSKAPLIKAVVVKGVTKNYLFIDIHHIVCDGTSVNILTRDLRDLYLGKKLPKPELEYIDFAEWVRKGIDNQEVHRNYWAKKLSGNLRRLNLPILQERESVENNAVSKLTFSVGNDLYRKIKSFSREAEVTDFMFFLSVYYLMVNKITGDHDVIIGTDAIGRSSKNLEEIVGTFVNILPLRVDINGNSSYSKFLDKVKDCVLEAFEHQEYPYDQIVSMVGSKTKQLVDLHFSFDNTIDNSEELEELQFKNVVIEEEAERNNADVINNVQASYDLEVVVSDNDGRFQVLFNYNSSLYDEDTMAIFADIFTSIISNVLNNQKIEIDDIGIESEMSIS